MRAAWCGFSSPLAGDIERYLGAKRAMGCKFASEDRGLRLLDRYLVEQRVTLLGDVTGACLEQFLASRGRVNARGFNHLLGAVRRLFDWMVDQQGLVESPLQLRPKREGVRRQPFLFDTDASRRLLAAAALLPDNSRAPMRGPAYETMFALLAGLGLRIGEVARLQCGDVDLEREALQIRDTKFGKSRLVPFGPKLSARSASADKRPPGVRTGSGRKPAQKRSSSGCRPCQLLVEGLRGFHSGPCTANW